MATPKQPTPEPSADELTFSGDLGSMLTQARRPQRWFLTNPGPDAPIPEGAYVKRGYPVDVAGLVVAIERVPTKHGPMPVYVLDVGKGPDFPLIRWGLTATLLRNANARHNVAVGDKIAAHCAGKRTGKTVNTETGELQEYEDWTLLVQKGDGTIPLVAEDSEAPF